MARNVFFSFHFDEDCHRASQIRNIGAINGNTPARDNDWESIKRGGDAAIKKWIDGQLFGTTCTIVLIGAHTAGRPWINYEIEQSWNRGNGVLGIYIHRLKNLAGNQSIEGDNVFRTFTLGPDKKPFTNIVQTYYSPQFDSKQVYAYIASSIELWVEIAVQIRGNY